MRDVILVNTKSKVKTKVKHPQSGGLRKPVHADDLDRRGPGDARLDAGDVEVQKGKGKKKVTKKFRLVNTHFEAFDDETQHPSIRALQAGELLAGPASSEKSIILGDFNSNNPPVKPGDEQAHDTLVAGGFSERSITDPVTCCINDLYAPTNTFDHKVDHVMTNMGKKVKLVNSSATGTTPVNGIYDSDHAGGFSKLKIK